ncbi:50S ribosomal protein L35 [bacterium]|nr:50S ribosomal protein L35 [bacterium]
MPKVKVKGSVKKRLRTTASGQLKRAKCGHSHILTKKTAKRKRRLRETTVVDATNVKRIKRLLGQ